MIFFGSFFHWSPVARPNSFRFFQLHFLERLTKPDLPFIFLRCSREKFLKKLAPKLGFFILPKFTSSDYQKKMVPQMGSNLLHSNFVGCIIYNLCFFIKKFWKISCRWRQTIFLRKLAAKKEPRFRRTKNTKFWR